MGLLSVVNKRKKQTAFKTRSSAVAKRPRDASCRWIFR